MWLLAAVAGALCVATGALPWQDAVATTERVGPILGFLAAVTVLAELADAAQVFDAAAVAAARLARGRTRVLFAFVVVLAAVTTMVLSLDTTAVLFTPVVLALAEQVGLPPTPFAMTTVWLANTASLLLPVSNLTNLLAVDRLHLSAIAFAARMWLPAAVAIAVTTIVIGYTYRSALHGRFTEPTTIAIADRNLFHIATAACLGVIPFFLLGFPVWAVATGGAAVLTGAFAVRRRKVLRFSLIPWQLVLLVEGLFLVIATLGTHGLDAALARLAGTANDALGVLRTSVIGALASNLVNNLPSYLALERVADQHTDRLLGLLLGTNLGPLITLWGSLATLLWRERCRARGVRISAAEFARVGVRGVPVMLVATWAALILAR